MKSRIAAIKKQTNNKFLNMYEVTAVKRNGDTFPYFVATRRNEGDLMLETGELKADGVVIYAVSRKNPDQILLLKQFRYPINDYVYEVPAGLIDAAEDYKKAAVREVKEETGLDFTAYEDYSDSIKRPYIQSQGMADECNYTVYGYVDGEISNSGQEDTEDISVFFADKKKVQQILAEGKVSIRAAYLLMHFLNSEKDNPFAFLPK